MKTKLRFLTCFLALTLMSAMTYPAADTCSFDALVCGELPHENTITGTLSDSTKTIYPKGNAKVTSITLGTN